MYVYEGFDDAKTKAKQVLFQVQIKTKKKKRSRRKLSLSLSLLKESLSDFKGLASQHSFQIDNKKVLKYLIIKRF